MFSKQHQESLEFSKENLVAQEGLGDAYSALGKFDDAIEVYEKIITTQTGVPCLRAFRKAMPASFWLGDLNVIAHIRGLAAKIIPYITPR